MSDAHKGQKAWNKGVPHTEEAKQKMRESNTGRKHTEETKNKMSKSRKGHPTSNETRDKITKSKFKKVINLTTRIIYNSLYEALQACKNKKAHISCVCRNKRKLADGHEWKFYEE